MTKYSWAENYRATQVSERLFLTSETAPYRYIVAEDTAGKQRAYGIRSHLPLGQNRWRKVYEELADPDGVIRTAVLTDSAARARVSSPAQTQGYDLREGPLTIWFGGEIVAGRLPRDNFR